MTSGIGNINMYSFSNVGQNISAGKLYVPVNKTALLYSHFDHVSGVVAKKGQVGLSISKIRILNTLIERMSAIKNKAKVSITDISDERADALIKKFQEELKNALATPYILSGAQPMAGDLFSIQA